MITADEDQSKSKPDQDLWTRIYADEYGLKPRMLMFCLSSDPCPIGFTGISGHLLSLLNQKDGNLRLLKNFYRQLSI